jgi:hypothetical protein
MHPSTRSRRSTAALILSLLLHLFLCVLFIITAFSPQQRRIFKNQSNPLATLEQRLDKKTPKREITTLFVNNVATTPLEDKSTPEFPSSGTNTKKDEPIKIPEGTLAHAKGLLNVTSPTASNKDSTAGIILPTPFLSSPEQPAKPHPEENKSTAATTITLPIVPHTNKEDKQVALLSPPPRKRSQLTKEELQRRALATVLNQAALEEHTIKKSPIPSLHKGIPLQTHSDGPPQIPGDERNLPFISLDSGTNLKFASYQKRLLKHINTTINQHIVDILKEDEMINAGGLTYLLANEHQAYITLVINKDGSVDLEKLSHASGNPLMIRVITELFKRAAPFPRLPQHLNTEKLSIAGSFVIPVTQNLINKTSPYTGGKKQPFEKNSYRRRYTSSYVDRW